MDFLSSSSTTFSYLGSDADAAAAAAAAAKVAPPSECLPFRPPPLLPEPAAAAVDRLETRFLFNMSLKRSWGAPDDDPLVLGPPAAAAAAAEEAPELSVLDVSLLLRWWLWSENIEAKEELPTVQVRPEWPPPPIFKTCNIFVSNGCG